MKLLELIGQLITLHATRGDLEVILQGDCEGNDYTAISGAEFTFYDGESTTDDPEQADEYGYDKVIVVYP